MVPHPVPYDTQYARYEFNQHGEDWILHILQDKLNMIFDVGSNIGEWTKMAREFNPLSEIHTFEIIPETYKKLIKNLQGYHNIIPNGFGLANFTGSLDMQFRPDCDTICSYLPTLEMENSSWIKGLVFKGDDYVKSRRINYIDYLKIDVEGSEQLVLEGFENTLNEGKVGIIQFEHSEISVLANFLILDAYNLLKPLGYHLGRLCKGWVEFKEYSLKDEEFRSPDFIAVHDSKMDWLKSTT